MADIHTGTGILSPGHILGSRKYPIYFEHCRGRLNSRLNLFNLKFQLTAFVESKIDLVLHCAQAFEHRL